LTSGMADSGGDQSQQQVRKSRRELEQVVDQQRDQLQKYETRLRDLVRAYKGLAKEREALDAVIRFSNESKGGAAASTSQEGGGGEEGASNSAAAAAANEALKTITTEKSRLEAMFQEDKKKTLAEKAALEAAKAKAVKERGQLKAELEEMKAKWMVERHQRDKESDDHALQMREMQKILAEERAAKEALESKVKASAAASSEASAAAASKAALDEALKQVTKLERELKDKEGQVKAEESKRLEETSSLRLQMEKAEVQHKRALERAEERADRAESRGAGIRSEQESRVINLEARLQELSEAVGTYDRLRQQDQSSIFKLKERVHQLESEKTELQSSQRNSPKVADETLDEDSNLGVQTLMDKILRLKGLLREANRRSGTPMDLEQFLDKEEEEEDEENGSKWKEMFLRLKDEFSELKKRNNHATSNPSLLLHPSPSRSKLMADQDQELERLRDKVSDLQVTLKEGRRHADSLQLKVGQGERRNEELEAEIVELKKEAKDVQSATVKDLKNRIVQLEAEVSKQRQRCLTIIEEKEDEVAMLKSTMESTIEMAFRASSSNKHQTTSKSSSESGQQQQQLAAAAAALIGTSSGGSGTKQGSSSRRRLSTRSENVAEDLTATSTQQTEGMVLYYEEELNLKSQELSGVNQMNRELESTLRELQMKWVEKEERYLDTIDSLEDRVETLMRMSTKEGANTEYLKNVVLTYMLSSDAGSREHMLKAIGACLTFTKDDLAKVRDYNASWWAWPSAAATDPDAATTSSGGATTERRNKMFKGGGAPKS